jgi:hypothetical protein
MLKRLREQPADVARLPGHREGHDGNKYLIASPGDKKVYYIDLQRRQLDARGAQCC